MNIKRVVEELKKKYPRKNIVIDDKDGHLEIICEIEPSREHPEYSIALAVVGKNTPHYHKNSTEIYEVEKGKMILHLGEKSYRMKKENKKKIRPGVIHWVETDEECWFLTYSNPGWVSEDHIVVSNKE